MATAEETRKAIVDAIAIITRNVPTRFFFRRANDEG